MNAETCGVGALALRHCYQHRQNQDPARSQAWLSTAPWADFRKRLSLGVGKSTPVRPFRKSLSGLQVKVGMALVTDRAVPSSWAL